MSRILLLFILLISFTDLKSAPADTTNVILNFEEYMNTVRRHHPVARQADLATRIGDLAIQEARGGFDPVAVSDVAQKYFKGDQYYSNIHGGLKLPTWFGIELQAGYEVNAGDFLNPADNTPDAGLWLAGISLPVGQGLFIDKRRAELRKAEVFRAQTEVQQRAMMNELLFEAGLAYWDWYQAYATYEVFNEALDLASERFEAVNRAVELGDERAIDTLEASLQVQNRRVALQNAELQLANARLKASIYLWAEGLIPLEIDSLAVPAQPAAEQRRVADSLALTDAMATLAVHPGIQTLELTQASKEIDLKVNKELLKPVLNLKYNAISEPQGGNPFAGYSISDYTWGLEFRMPLFLRRERANVKQSEVELQNIDLEMQYAQASLANAFQVALNTWRQTFDQLELVARTVRDSRALVTSEQQLFDAGESSLFLVNSRELVYINSELKFIETVTKNQFAALNVAFSLGDMNLLL